MSDEAPPPYRDYRPAGERIQELETISREQRSDMVEIRKEIEKLTGKIDLILFAQREHDVYTAWGKWIVDIGKLILVALASAGVTNWMGRHP